MWVCVWMVFFVTGCANMTVCDCVDCGIRSIEDCCLV